MKNTIYTTIRQHVKVLNDIHGREFYVKKIRGALQLRQIYDRTEHSWSERCIAWTEDPAEMLSIVDALIRGELGMPE